MNSITCSHPAAPRSRARGVSLPASRTWLAAGQWLVTLLLCAFLIVPVVMSIMAGLTVNYFKGVSSGLTLRWLDRSVDAVSRLGVPVARSRGGDARHHAR